MIPHQRAGLNRLTSDSNVTTDTGSPACWRELIAPAPLVDRIAPALVSLGLTRRITWDEGRFVLDAVAYFNEHEAQLARIRERLQRAYDAAHGGGGP